MEQTDRPTDEGKGQDSNLAWAPTLVTGHDKPELSLLVKFITK